MKVIFLDVDGVLNSEEWAIEKISDKRRGYGGFFREDTNITKDDVLWDPRCVDYLYKIVSHTNAKIVMSSTWRLKFSVKKFKEMFALYGWKNVPVIDKTIELGSRNGIFYDNTCRGLEVNEWLNRNKDVENYVILDDISQFLPDQMEQVNRNSSFSLF